MSNNKQNRNELIINAFLDECISFDEPNNNGKNLLISLNLSKFST